MAALTYTAETAPEGRFAQVTMAARMALLAVTALWVFSGGFVLFEPSPYEMMFMAVLGLSLVAGIEIHPRTRNLLVVMLLFFPAAMIAATRVQFTPVSEALVYSTVTLFLLLTSFIAANYIAQSPFARMRVINSAYIAAAVVIASIGILAYMGVLPGEDVFLKFGRAKATFKDPNVYGPFLIYPAAVLVQRILLGTARQVLVSVALFLVIFVGLFVSFSRGAWGHLAMTAGLVFLGTYFLAAAGRLRGRMLVMAVAGAAIMVVVLAGLLSLEPVRSLFEVRAEVVQEYDTGDTGRFGRQGVAAVMALSDPLGQGPRQFGYMGFGEEPHNTYVKVFLAYGWVGGFAMVWLVAMTLMRGIKTLAIPSPNRLLLIPAMATFVPLAVEAAIIDIDHWRHFFLIIGIVWGITAGYERVSAAQRAGALP